MAAIAAGSCFGDALSDALRAGRFEDAVTLADSLLKIQPEDARLWTGRGIALAQLKRERESLESFDKALQYAPTFLPALKAAAETGYRTRDTRTAGYLDHILALDPGNAIAHAMSGVLAFEAGDCRRSVDHFERARAETSDNPQAGPMYGACLVAVGRAGDAVGVFERLLARDPKSGKARFNLGYAQVLAHRDPDAVKTLEPLALAGNADAGALNLLASAEASSGHLEPAVAHLQEAIRKDPKDEKNYLDLASLCMKNESNETALYTVEAGLAKVPSSALLHTVRGILKAQQGHHDQAELEFDLANRLDPGRQYGAAGLGVLYTETRQAGRASAVLRARLHKSPNDGTLSFLLAQALVQEGAAPGSPEFLEAVKSLKDAIAAKPDPGKAHSLLGKLYAQSGNYAQAVEELRAAARYDPTDRMAFSQLAVSLRRLGRMEEAAAAVEGLKRIIAEEARPKGNYKVIRTAPAR